METKPETLRELLARYRRENLIDGSKLTVNKHRIAIRHLEKTLGRKATLDDLTNASIAKMMHRLSERGRLPATINGYRAKLHALWTWACKQGWLTIWPSTRKLREPRRTVIAWSPGELATLWGALETQPGYIAGIPAALWWKSYHVIAWDTGSRHGERMALRWDHFSSFDQGVGCFPAEIRKMRSADLPFTLHPLTVKLLREVQAFGFPVVLPWDLDRGYFWLLYTNLLKSANLPHDWRHKSHCLRRSFATHLVARGLQRSDAGAALGHSDPSIIDLYIDGSRLPRVNPHDILPRMWEMKDAPPDDPRAA